MKKFLLIFIGLFSLLVANPSFGLSSSISEEFAQQILRFSTEANGQNSFAKEEKSKTQVANVLGLGSPCLDYFVETEKNESRWCEIDAATVARLLTQTPHPIVFSGDSVSNTIKGLASMGVPCRLTGFIGADSAGEKIQEIFTKIGVETLFTTTDVPTSQIICCVDPNGERSFQACVEAEKQMTHTSLKEEDFSGADLVIISGFHLPQIGYIERGFELAKKNGSLIAFDLANATFVSQYRERLWELLPTYVDILFSNEEEAFAFSQLPAKEAAVFLKNFCKISIVKVGEKGCWICSQEGLFYSPGIPTQAADTTGAGDLFASGFLYAYLKGESLKRCAYLGNLVGSAVVERFGAEIPSERWPEILRIFSDCNQTDPSL